MPIRVLLADDHRLVRRALREVLSRNGEIQVVGEAGDGREALTLARELQPDVIVMDVAMPRLCGLEATRRIVQERPSTAVLALSMYCTEECLRDAVLSGARGVLFKDATPDELIRAVKALARGEVSLPRGITPKVVRQIFAGVRPAPPSTLARLTPREREVLQLLAEGFTPKEVARELHISVRTVESHRTSLMRKLDLHTTAALVRFAIRKHLVDPGADRFLLQEGER